MFISLTVSDGEKSTKVEKTLVVGEAPERLAPTINSATGTPLSEIRPLPISRPKPRSTRCIRASRASTGSWSVSPRAAMP